MPWPLNAAHGLSDAPCVCTITVKRFHASLVPWGTLIPYLAAAMPTQSPKIGHDAGNASVNGEHGITQVPSQLLHSEYGLELYPIKARDEINYLFRKVNGATVEVWEWMSIFIPHFTVHVITHPCWNQGYSMLANYTQTWLYIQHLEFCFQHFGRLEPSLENSILLLMTQTLTYATSNHNRGKSN